MLDPVCALSLKQRIVTEEVATQTKAAVGHEGKRSLRACAHKSTQFPSPESCLAPDGCAKLGPHKKAWIMINPAEPPRLSRFSCPTYKVILWLARCCSSTASR